MASVPDPMSAGASRRRSVTSAFAIPRRDRRDTTSRDRLLTRVQSEFEEMPSLRLTFDQACRLFSLAPDVCGRILTRLLDDDVIWIAEDGRYCSAAARRFEPPSLRTPFKPCCEYDP